MNILFCPNCDKEQVHTELVKDYVQINTDFAQRLDLPDYFVVIIPVRTCVSCAFSYTDFVAEEIRDKAYREWCLSSSNPLGREAARQI